MAEKYKDKVAFLMVYIREAHAENEGKAPINERQGIRLNTAENFEEKEEHATMCVLKLDIGFTTVIDNFDAKVEQDYAAWPDRLYLVARDGRIAMKGAQGPMGFKPDQLEEAIQKEISSW